MAMRWRRRVGHVPKGVSYAVQNSRWWLRVLKILGILWIDYDGHITKDGIPVCGHWGLIARNGFLLPKWFKKKYGKRPRIKDVYWEDLKQLQTGVIWFRGRRRYKFQTLWSAIQLAVSLGERIMYEQKGDVGFTHKAFWEVVESKLKSYGMSNSHFVVATLPTMRNAGEVLTAAHAAGRQTMVIRAQDGVPRKWEPNMTWYRGKIQWKG